MIPWKNPAKLLGTFTPGSAQWHDTRATGLGGSEIAAVLGLSPWKSHFTLWHEKNGMARTAPTNLERLHLGNVLEPVVCELYETHQPGRGLRKTGMWHHRERPWQLAEPDRFITGSNRRGTPRGIFEAKTVSGRVAHLWGPTGGSNDDIPPYYLAQVQWYLSVFDLPFAVLGALFGCGEYREYEIRGSVEDQQFLIDAGAWFVESLESGEAPDPDGTNSTFDTLKKLHPDIDETQNIEIPYRDAAALLDAQETKKTSEREYKDLLAVHAAALGEGHRVTCAGSTILTRSISKQGSISYRINPRATIQINN